MRQLTVGTLQDFIDDYISTHDGAEVDYIHGEDSIRELSLSRGDAIGFTFDGMSKSELFRTVIFDGAHNPEGVDGAVKSVKQYFGDKKIIALSGVLGDKDYSYIARRISDIADVAYTITPDNPRALNAEEYAEELRKNGVDAYSCCSIADAVAKALERAKNERRALICLGSLYTYGDVLYEITTKT